MGCCCVITSLHLSYCNRHEMIHTLSGHITSDFEAIPKLIIHLTLDCQSKLFEHLMVDIHLFKTIGTSG